MTSPGLRLAALISAALILVSSLAGVVILAISGHLDERTAPIVISLVALAVTSVPTLLTFALATQIHGLVNGNMSKALDALGTIASANPDRRASDVANAALPTDPPPAVAP